MKQQQQLKRRLNTYQIYVPKLKYTNTLTHSIYCVCVYVFILIYFYLIIIIVR